jgi:glycosyltransferase involved in cell wall biosynthesis
VKARQPSRPVRRILWIAYVFPPVGGTEGLRMVRYLEEIVRADPQIAVDVLTVQPDTAVPQYDPALVRALPASVRVVRVQPGALHRLRYRFGLDGLALSRPPWRRALARAVISLSNLAWIPRATCLLWKKRVCAYVGVYIFVDPFASLLLALVARRVFRDARIVMEYGDPRLPCRSGPRPLLTAARYVERRALLCGKAIFRTHEAVQLYQSHYPAIPSSNLSVLYGGVDWEAYDAVAAGARTKEFQIVYTGTIYADSVDPSPFMEAIAEVALSGRSITVLIAGAPDPGMVRLTRVLGLENVVTFRGHVPAADLPAIQRSATLLLAFGFRNPYKLSSKLAQYVAARVPILYLAGSPSEPGAKLVAEARRGIVVPNRVTQIAEGIEAARQLWEKGEMAVRFDLSRTGEFSWAQAAKQILPLLDGVGPEAGKVMSSGGQ